MAARLSQKEKRSSDKKLGTAKGLRWLMAGVSVSDVRDVIMIIIIIIITIIIIKSKEGLG